MKVIAENRKARHIYTIVEKAEAGIELRGTEVKSLRKDVYKRQGDLDSPLLIQGGPSKP